MQKDDLPARYTPMVKSHNHSAPGEAEIHKSTMILSPCLLHVINGLLHLLPEEQGGK